MRFEMVCSEAAIPSFKASSMRGHEKQVNMLFSSTFVDYPAHRPYLKLAYEVSFNSGAQVTASPLQETSLRLMQGLEFLGLVRCLLV